MKQLLNKWLKNSQLSKNGFNLNHFSHAIFGQNCVICGAKNGAKSSTKNSRKSNTENSLNHPREENDALGTTVFKTNGHAACRACLESLPWHSAQSCPQCGLNSDGNICGSCLNNPPDFDATKAVFLYAYPIDAMMLRYKYGDSLNLGDTFAEFLAEKVNVEDCLKNIDLIIPMPMHPQRLKERGFNQAIEIAKVLAKNCKEKLDYKSTIRQTLTPPQASLPLKERVKNIKGAFKVNADKLVKIQGKRIAIIDDVMTTGASLNELAKTLKKAGASHVECWVITRTLPH
jgi:ComF family protein